MADGNYYLVVGAFNTTFADFSAFSTSTATGAYNVNLNGVSIDSGTLAAGGLRTVEFSVGTVVPEPTSAVILLGVAGLAAVRRRR